MKKLAIALSIIAVTSTPALAEGNAEAGKTKAVTCAACHGADGNSVISMYPKLAGQHAAYLEKQLHDFKHSAQTAGKQGRMDPIMAGMSLPLSDQDIKDVSAFFASQQQTQADIKDVPALGKQLYQGGDPSRGITACIACHGPNGNGAELAGFPKIGGQHADYIKIQLEKFHNSSRANDLNGMMQDVAKKLTPTDIQALSSYIANLKP